MQVIGFELNLYGIITPLSLTHKHLHAHVCVLCEGVLPQSVSI